MKASLTLFAFLLVVALGGSSAVAFEWHPNEDVETSDNPAISPPAMRRMQVITEDSSAPAGSSSSASSTSAASTTSETDTPTTIMVLLPDILAPSGSGSTMFFDDSVGDEHESKSAGSDTAADKTSAAASVHNVGCTMVAVAMLLFSLALLA